MECPYPLEWALRLLERAAAAFLVLLLISILVFLVVVAVLYKFVEYRPPCLDSRLYKNCD